MWETAYKNAPFAFYGQLAAESIGYGVPYNWEDPALPLISRGYFGFPAARRSVALIQIGSQDSARKELRRLVKRLNAKALPRYMVFAQNAGLIDLSYAIAYTLQRDYGARFHTNLYPKPLWHPSDGFKLDPKLIFAFIRQESGFNPQARSSADARGLMQLMPATARFINRGKIDKNQLYDPSLNISLGQKYLLHLMDHDKNPNEHMLSIVASYNAGPGNVTRWMARSDLSHDDPLLYIESIPWRETRHFVKKVMSNFWAYHDKDKIFPQTRQNLAAGKWPSYSP
jgi:soluble lytic murein transglycosylase-like protein